MAKNPSRFIVDVGVGKKVQSYLTQKNYDVLCVRDIDPRLPDEEILEIAVKEQRILITMDKDFGELVYNSGHLHKGVLLLRMEDKTGEEKVKVVSNIVEQYIDRLEGNFSVFKDGNLRIRK